MRKLLLKTMLLLCALIVGSGTMWAETVTLTNANIVAVGNAQSGYNSYSIDDSNGNTWNAFAIKNYHSKATSSNHYLQIKKYASNTNTAYYVQVPTLGTKITSIVMTVSGASQPMTGGGNTATLYFSSSNSTSAAGTGVASGTGASSVTIDCSSLDLNTGYITASAGVRIWDIEVTYTTSGGTPTAAYTTTTIDASGIANTDVYTSTTAGSLSASVTSGGNAVQGATVTWSGDNDDVATIDASTGAVTLVGAGKVTFTASYAGVTDEYLASSATYEMTVTSSAPYVQPTEFDIALNNTLFGTTYNGSASGITDETPISGSQDNVTVTYAGSGNHYVNDSQIRFYPNNNLTFEAPSGYVIKEIVFTSASGGTWAATISANSGTYTSSTKTWAGEAASVLFTGSGSSRCDMSKATITLGVPSSDPSISADDVNIAYDATSSSIEYTLTNEVTGGVLSATSSENWLTIGTVNSTAVPFTCSANEANTERTATVTLTYTYGDNETVTKDVTVTQAAAPVIYTTIPALFAAATTTAEEVLITFNNWVVSGVSTNGKNVFVTDNNGNGFVIFDNNSGLGSTYAVGNILSGTAVTCSLVKYNGFAELTNLDASNLTITSGGTVSTANVTMDNLAGVNTGALVSYQNLTCSIGNNKYYLSDGTTTIQVYNALYAFDALESGKTYNITGVYQQFNSTKEILPRSVDDIEKVVVTTPTITVSSASLTDFTYEVDNGPSTTKTVSVSGSNLTADITLSLGNNSDFEMSTTEGSGYTNSLTLTQNAGAVAATTVYVRLKANLPVGNSYSGTITITSTDATDASVCLSGSVTEPVVDYVTLPFSFNNGKSNLVAGLSQNGLGTDYASSSAPNTQLKFDGTGDYLILKLGNNDDPGMLSFETKSNGFSGGTFTVQTSVNGSDYTDLMYYDETTGHYLGSVDNFILSPSVRYIKWIYTEKSSGNVGLGNIQVSKRENVSISSAGYATFCSTSPLNFTEEDGIYAYTASVNGENISFERTYKVPANTGVLLYSIKKEAVSASVPVLLGNPSEISTNLFVAATTEIASLASEANNCTNYILNNGSEGIGFYLANGHRVGAGKAYLAVPNNAGIRGFIGFDFSDPTTGIAVVKDELQQTEGAYDLQGRRVSEPKNGLYIINGKKVLVK